VQHRFLVVALLLAACGRDEPIVIGADLEPLPASPAPTQAPPKPAEAPPPAARPQPPPANTGGESWNAAQIRWMSYADGLARAKAENKPVCLVFYTTWCPHCRNYSRVFDDPKIVERARDFVMIRVNPDEQADIGEKYAPDGGYVPRTFFLAPDGTLMADVRAPRPKFLYFFDEHDPKSLLGGMEAALKKRGG
jgi:thiol-disulfide isomerase/thioredoxin